LNGKKHAYGGCKMSAFGILLTYFKTDIILMSLVLLSNNMMLHCRTTEHNVKIYRINVTE